MASTIIEQARGSWPDILEASGIKSSYLNKKHGPCPMCGGTDRFRFDDKEGRGTYICNQCGAGDGFQLLQRCHGWTPKEAFAFLERQLQGGPEIIGDILKRSPLIQNNLKLQKDAESCRKALKLVWSQSQLITEGDPVDRYLRARNIKLQSWPKILRYHPRLPYYDNEKGLVIGEFPAMIALVQDQYNKKITIHRTYLGDGCKADVPHPKKLMSPVVKGASTGAAIRLYPPTEDGELCLAEGIETAFAVHVATGLPVWATVSAVGMERVILPTEINNVIIAVDNDHSNTGQKAAAELAYRLLTAGKKVKCIMPPRLGDDFADLLLEDTE